MRNEYGYTAIPCVRWDFLGLMISQEQPVTGVQSLDVIPNMNPSCNNVTNGLVIFALLLERSLHRKNLMRGVADIDLNVLHVKSSSKNME